MSELTQADRYLLDRIRRGEPDGWSQLVDRYQGRLLAFARSRLPDADAEDQVQETFIAFLKNLAAYREQASVETYLFTILRRRISTCLRRRRVSVCMVQDTIVPAGQDEGGWQVASPDPTASWYVRRDERQAAQQQALAQALREMVGALKSSLNFQHLAVVELIFYSQLRNKDVAQIVGLDEKRVAMIKHRSLKRIRQRVAGALAGVASEPASDAMLTEAWEQLRLSCPKRSTIGGYLLKTLDDAWQGYVDFHLNQLGCRFCLANLDDLRRKSADTGRRRVHEHIMQSTVGFL